MNNKRKPLHLIIPIMGFFLLLSLSIIVKTEIGWAVSVKPILPENQHNPKATYYDLKMTPKQEQDLKLELTNTSDKEQEVILEINDATTNESGDIDYSDRSKLIPRDKTLKVSLKDIATTNKKIVVPPNQTTVETIHLKMPAEQFDGMVLGGIKVISSKKNSKKEQTSSDDEKIYIVAVKITETDIPVEAELNLVKISPPKDSDKNIIKATIQNNQAVNLEDIEYTAKIYKKDSKKILHQFQVTGYRMAPHSSFDFVIDLKKQLLQPGDYQLMMTAKSKDTGQIWKWEEAFEIVKMKNKELNARNSNLDKENILFYIIICVITLVFLLLLLIILLISRKRKEERYQIEVYYKNKKRKQKKKEQMQHSIRPKNSFKKSRKKRKQS
ncbi:DUF916 and DUF3324 domain-containing protein [Candidatus Enterococcus mansonii]|uniref:Uncharacterized protein n=1 Tax=Candidatus Enterococcus mansonii TaxID=1834181 RepID=A0A242BY36_9ENTE|nr:DUF916 and DUF3324 domain-containing protein [Enterococcus sp. 4G2_DIV0659]OTO02766.1 hypothetical protein A5880_003179 [Enterococcus sp. 4G2_DIV0659]